MKNYQQTIISMKSPIYVNDCGVRTPISLFYKKTDYVFDQS